MRRLADKFPAPPTIAIDVSLVDVGPSLQKLLEEKETAVEDATIKTNALDKENAGLRAKVDRLQKDVDFISKDRYALVRENCILQNKLGDFNSWPEFRVEYDELTTKFEAMKRQRAREHISQEQVLHIAKEAKLELAAAKRDEAMRKIDHNEELKQVQQERDEAKKRYQTLLAKTTAATTTAVFTTAAITTAVSTTTTVAKANTPGDIALQEEIARLTLALRSQTSLLSKKSCDLDRMQSLLKTRSNHSASQLKTAASTISSLEEDKAKGEERIAELEKDVQEANEKAEEMEEMYMAVAFMDEGEGEKEKEEEKGEDEEEGSEEEKGDTSWLLKQVVAMNKKGRKGTGAAAGGSGTDGSGSENEDDGEEEEEEDDDDDDNDEGDGETKGEDEEEKKIHDENEDLFKDMMGSP